MDNSIDPIKNSTAFLCECGNDVFIPAMNLRRISRLLTGDAKDSIMQIPTLVCVKCWNIPEDLKPHINDIGH